MTLLSFTYFMHRCRRRKLKMADGDLVYFWMEYSNAVDPKNLAKDASPMFLSVIVLEISWTILKFWTSPIVLYLVAQIQSEISREL